MITLRCLVDNHTTDAASLRVEHGLAFLIETPSGKILFDTGQSGEVLQHNASLMGVDLRQIDALVLSHAHYDHTGGLEAFLQICRPGLPVYAHPDIFCERYAITDGQVRSIGLCMAQAELAERTTLNLSAMPAQVLPEVWTTGEITDRTEFEGRSSHHFIQVGQHWLPDPYQDDLSLVLDMPTGAIVVCGCCHAGLLNTLAQVKRSFNRVITAIVGGTHLTNLDEKVLEHTINVLRSTNMRCLPNLYLNHCTGERALATLVQAFGEKVNPCPAGTVLRFD